MVERVEKVEKDENHISALCPVRLLLTAPTLNLGKYSIGHP